MVVGRKGVAVALRDWIYEFLSNTCVVTGRFPTNAIVPCKRGYCHCLSCATFQSRAVHWKCMCSSRSPHFGSSANTLAALLDAMARPQRFASACWPDSTGGHSLGSRRPFEGVGNGSICYSAGGAACD